MNYYHIKPKKFTCVNTYLKHYNFTHINHAQKIHVPAGFDYGDKPWFYHTFPLEKALDNNYVETDKHFIQLLLDAGADPNLQPDIKMGNVLHALIMSGRWDNTNNINVTNNVINNINVINNTNNNVPNNNNVILEIIELLIQYGINVNNNHNYTRSTPLHKASIFWNKPYAEQIIELLIKNGAAIYALNLSNETPYDIALETLKWHSRKHKTIPKKIIDMLKPKNTIMLNSHNKLCCINKE